MLPDGCSEAAARTLLAAGISAAAPLAAARSRSLACTSCQPVGGTSTPLNSPSQPLPLPHRSYSPHITEMKVLESRKVRRAKLYYLRERTAKEYRT